MFEGLQTLLQEAETHDLKNPFNLTRTEDGWMLCASKGADESMFILDLFICGDPVKVDARVSYFDPAGQEISRSTHCTRNLYTHPVPIE